MTEWLESLFASVFGTHSGIATFLISMMPIIELRGAIPFGTAVSFWGENALSLWESFFISIAGSSLSCVILTFLFWPLFMWLKKTKCFKKLGCWFENKLKKNSKNITDKTEIEKNEKRIKRLKMISIFGFVALPIPLTGVWMGTCLALFVGLNKLETMSMVLSGNILAGLLMLLITLVFKDNTVVVFYGFLILFAVVLIIAGIKSIVKHVKNKRNKDSEIENKETYKLEDAGDKTEILLEENINESKNENLVKNNEDEKDNKLLDNSIIEEIEDKKPLDLDSKKN